MQEYRFAAAEVARLCHRARRAEAETHGRRRHAFDRFAFDPPEGWSRSPADPMRVLAVFQHLHLEPGWVLRAYQYIAGFNGNGVVWAMPADAPFPVPAAGDDTPHPPGALHFTRVLLGDGTPDSYLQASLLVRELGEFGARWHGVEWPTHRVLDANPLLESSQGRSEFPGPTPAPEAWRWEEPRPERWAPLVQMWTDEVLVTLHTFSPLGVEAVYRHVDRYHRAAGYRFTTQRTCLATGPGEMTW